MDTTSPPTDSIVALTRKLVSIPSQGGIDSPAPVLAAVAQWLRAEGLEAKVLCDDKGAGVAVLAEIEGRLPGRTYCLNACVDTAPFGDESAWRRPPASGEIADGYLFGRGSADCKVAVSLFCHLAVHFHEVRAGLRGRVSFLFDGDEHTGEFGGIKQYAKLRPDVSGVLIGYPGNEEIGIGSRGFYRTVVTVFGTAKHSGSRTGQQDNAVYKAAALVEQLALRPLAEPSDSDFPVAPRLSVTGIDGGGGFSMVPDRCDVAVDIRITRKYTAESARQHLATAVAEVDSAHPSRLPSRIGDAQTWPAYRLSDDSLIRAALCEAAESVFRRKISPAVFGPSNIANFLAAKGIEATCGFGVSYKNTHAADECIEIATIAPVYEVYARAIVRLAGSE